MDEVCESCSTGAEGVGRDVPGAVLSYSVSKRLISNWAGSFSYDVSSESLGVE
jgi:hypothetical protein